MKRVVTILTLLLILTFRQGYAVLRVGQNTVNYAILLETNLIIGVPGLGWIEDRDNSDPKVTIPGLQAFHNKEQSLTCVETQERFKFSFHYHPNLLLIDRPPPTTGA